MIVETARHRKLILACGSLLAMAPLSSDLRPKCRLVMELGPHCHLFIIRNFSFSTITQPI